MSSTNIPLYLLSFLVLKMIIKFLFLFYYNKIKIAKNNINIISLPLSIEKIIAKYSDENKMHIKIDYNNNKKILKKRIKNNYTTTIYLNTNLNDYFYLDKLLGNLWIKKSKKEDKNFFLYRFLGKYFPLSMNIILYFVFMFEILMIIIQNIYYDSEIIILFNKYNLYFILLFFFFSLYILSIIFSYNCKKYYDKKYDNDIDKFIIKYFPELISDFIVVRHLHRSIYFTCMNIWCFKLINNSNVILGPFVTIY